MVPPQNLINNDKEAQFGGLSMDNALDEGCFTKPLYWVCVPNRQPISHTHTL